MEKLNELINFLFNKKNYTTVVMLAVAIFAVIYFSMQYTVPKFQEWQSELGDIEAKQVEYDNLLAKKQHRELEAKRNITRYEKVPVKIYKSEKAGLPIESSSIDFVTNILKMLETTHNSIIDISYQIDNISDSEKKAIPENISVVQLIMTINGTYTSFLDFVNTLYNYEYLATIKAIKSVPIKENKNILETELIIWLYIAQ